MWGLHNEIFVQQVTSLNFFANNTTIALIIKFTFPSHQRTKFHKCHVHVGHHFTVRVQIPKLFLRKLFFTFSWSDTL
jgi:hypothetical protein